MSPQEDTSPADSTAPEGRAPGEIVERVADGPPRVRPVLGGRAASRERAVHLLYEAAMKDKGANDILGSQLLAADPYATKVVSGVANNSADLDTLIQSLLPEDWTIERMALLDLAVIRVACFELTDSDDPPTGVVLSEAVELAEQYGTDESPRFVNGLLAAAAKRVR